MADVSRIATPFDTPTTPADAISFSNVMQSNSSDLREFRAMWRTQPDLDAGFCIGSLKSTELSIEAETVISQQDLAAPASERHAAAESASLAFLHTQRLLRERARSENANRAFTLIELIGLASRLERMAPVERIHVRSGETLTGYSIEESFAEGTLRWSMRRSGSSTILGRIHSNNGGLSWQPDDFSLAP